MPVFPDPDRYRRRPLRDWMRALVAALEADRVLPGPGLTVDGSKGGRVLSAQGADGRVFRIYTTSAITARSGTTFGTGTCKRLNGSTQIGPTLTITNDSGTAGATGKYGRAHYENGVLWLDGLEC